MGQTTFSQATARIVEARAFDDDGDFSAVNALERIILDHRPRTAGEAVAMLDLIIPDLAVGGRCDGRDVVALVSIRTLLSSL